MIASCSADVLPDPPRVSVMAFSVARKGCSQPAAVMLQGGLRAGAGFLEVTGLLLHQTQDTESVGLGDA
jgi:hypothetical protein